MSKRVLYLPCPGTDDRSCMHRAGFPVPEATRVKHLIRDARLLPDGFAVVGFGDDGEDDGKRAIMCGHCLASLGHLPVEAREQ